MSYYDEKTLEYIENNKLGLNDYFNFDCNQCGSCCRNRKPENSIILSGLDIFRIAKHFNTTTDSILQKHTEVYIGSDSKLPIVAIKQRTGDNTCPFLRQGKCLCHMSKPINCALYPLARALSTTGEYTYFKQDISCGNNQKIKVKDWLSIWGIQELDSACKAWGQCIIDLATYIIQIRDRQKLELTQHAIYGALYVSYDTTKGEYTEQLNKNMQLLQAVLPGFRVKN